MITRFINRTGLSDEAIRTHWPSVFAPQPIQGVSDSYTFIPTTKIISRMREEGWIPVSVEEQRVRLEGRRGFQKHMIRFQREGVQAHVNDFTPEVALVNSHDRSSAFQVHAALYRFVCSNGLMVSDSVFEHISVRHTGNETDEVLAASFTLMQQIPMIAERVRTWQGRHLTDPEANEFARKALLLRFVPGTEPIRPSKLLIPRRREDTGSDLWSVYNRVQESLLRGGTKDRGHLLRDGRRPRRMRGVSGLDQSVRLNKQLWGLADEYAFPA